MAEPILNSNQTAVSPASAFSLTAFPVATLSPHAPIAAVAATPVAASTPAGQVKDSGVALLVLWPRPVQLAVGVLLALFFLGILYQALGTSKTSTDADSRQALSPMDLNRMERDDFLLLPGVGDKLAQRIVERRNQAGPFKNVDDLLQVPGIGPATFKRLRPLVYVNSPAADVLDADPSEEMEPSFFVAKALSKKEKDLAGKRININQAEANDLQKLPGIGPKMAERILDYRQAKGPFRSAQDLRKVSGIGLKTLDKLKPYITLTPADDAAALAP